MIAPERRTHRSSRLVAAIAVCAVCSWSLAPAASADEFWGLWASEVKQRVWWEMPFVIALSLPPMVVTTPIWGITKLVTGSEDSEGDDE